MFLLDTCVLSEARRRTPAAVAWLANAEPDKQFVSAITLGEISKGIALHFRKDPVAAASLGNWLDNLRGQFADRVLPVDAAVAIAWGRMMAVRTLPVADGLIAATARVHGLVLVTRNVADFAGTGVEIVNPWPG
jgi:predicted nucleic acid-binding protein